MACTLYAFIILIPILRAFSIRCRPSIKLKLFGAISANITGSDNNSDWLRTVLSNKANINSNLLIYPISVFSHPKIQYYVCPGIYLHQQFSNKHIISERNLPDIKSLPICIIGAIVFCDGSVHDQPAVQEDDQHKRQLLPDAGFFI